MHSKGQSSSSLFRTISLAVIAALMMAVAMVPAWAQSSVPPTAVQAAKMPEFASRLAHPVKPQASRKMPPLAPARNHRGPLDSNDMYDNGPINGNTDAWTINFGLITSDSFNVASNNSTVAGMSFGAWLFSGDTLTSAEVSITSAENGGTSYFDQTVNFTMGTCTGNEYGYNVCTVTTSFNGPTLNAGTYWVNLQNASVPSGDPVYWDENSGVGCTGPGCPSSASQNDVGTIPSEAFTMLGGTITCANLPASDERPVAEAKAATVPPSPTQTFKVIYNFTGGVGGQNPAGLTMDTHGNLDGVAGGGASGDGMVFKLTPEGSNWRFTILYSFSGTDGNGPDSPPVVASNGIVYGTTEVGGGYSGGVLFGLSPAAHASPNVLSNWTERLRYSFTGGNDGSRPGGSLVLDSSGDIYGTAAGGVNNGGTLYEFTKGSAQVLHAFPAFPGDGTGPQGVVSGAGGLYGITEFGGASGTGTVYSLAGGYHVIYNFNLGSGWPLYMAADQAGNLYVSATYGDLIDGCYWIWYGNIFELTYPDWTPVTLSSWENLAAPMSAWVTPDASGNVYGTVNAGGDGEVFKMTCCWNYSPLHDFSGSDGAGPDSAPVIDAQGNIYGTTSSGGAYGYGVVWEITP
ncbi:MAG: choice-of-anchor tandem repeat GloVer-containing protein [Candidatus Korobacteraceae bacterium]